MFNTTEVIAVANAVYRKQGFIKKSEAHAYDIGPDTKVANSTHLYAYFYDGDKTKVSVTDVDRNRAEEIINYFRGLTFKAMERGLTSFEENVLKFVQSPQVGSSELGIAASLPRVFENKLEQDVWTDRENELSRTSEFVGELKQRCTFEAVVENVRWIGSTNSYLVCCSVDDANILKFFNQEDLAPVGRKVTVTGFVKSQSVSNFHGGKETMINRVKVEV